MSTRASRKETILGRLGDREVPAQALVEELAGEGHGRELTVAALIELRSEKKVSVDEPKPFATLGSYAFSPYSVWFWGVVAAVAASVALISVTSGVVLYARYVFGSALVLFLPGYALIEALYPKRDLDELIRFALSIGLSLALVPLTGLVLNYTPFGIRLLPVTLSIAGLTFALLLVALYRKHQYYRLSKGVV